MYEQKISALRYCSKADEGGRFDYPCNACPYYEKCYTRGTLMAEAADAIEELQKLCDALESDNDQLCTRLEKAEHSNALAYFIECNNNAGYKCSACKARVSRADVVHGNHRFCYKCGAKIIPNKTQI